jgi:hypothetical protein
MLRLGLPLLVLCLLEQHFALPKQQWTLLTTHEQRLLLIALLACEY